MQVNRLTTLKFATYAAFLCLALPKFVWASDYQDGLAAYIDGEFALAQQFWLKAANEKDAKSMFNLGLLHEQNKLESATIDKALNWYRLAADNGYAPAAYHLAQRMLERGGSDDDAIALIQASADSGYAPARRYLGLGSNGKLQTGASSKSTKASSAVAKSSSAASVEYQSENWINRQRSQNWTIQLLAFKSKEQVLAFINSHGLKKRAAYFSENRQGEVFYKLVYGSFDSKDKATFARQNLSSALQKHGPWLRTWSSVQKVTKR